MADAFISYRRKPSASLAHLLQKELQAHYHFDIYLDTTRTDSAKVQFPDRLLGAIDSSKVFICLLADSTLESEWVLREIERAYQQQKPCIPIFQESYKPLSVNNAVVDYLLGFDGVHILDERGLFIDEAIQQTARIVKGTIPQSRSLIRYLVIPLVLFVLAIAIIVLIRPTGETPPVSKTNTPNVVSEVQTDNPSAIETTTATLSAETDQTLSEFQPLETAEVWITQTAQAIHASIQTETEEYILNMDATATAEQLAITETAISAAITALSWSPTPQPTNTLIPTLPVLNTPTPTRTPTNIATLTMAPTVSPSIIESGTITGYVTASSANIRIGPDEEHAVIGYALQGSALIIIGRTNDGWYEIDTADSAISLNLPLSVAWISAGTVELNPPNSVPLSTLIPQAPSTSETPLFSVGQSVMIPGNSANFRFDTNGVVGGAQSWSKSEFSSMQIIGGPVRALTCRECYPPKYGLWWEVELLTVWGWTVQRWLWQGNLISN